MKSFLVAALAVLALSQAYANPIGECPPEDGPEDILLANAADCGSFYKCLAGVPTKMNCPSHLEWSAELKRCEYPDIAKCSETETESPVDPTSAPEPTEPNVTQPPVERPDHCPAVDGPKDVLLPNPVDCHSFFKCFKGEPILIQCPVGQEWADELQRCDFPEIAQCTTTGTNPTSAPVEPTDSGVTQAPVEPGQCPAVDGPEDVLLPNPDDCGSFFKCQNGIPVKIDCPVGQEWADKLHRCDWPAIAQCSRKISKPAGAKKIPAPAPVAKECPAVDGEDDVLLPNPADCGTFFKCNGGKPILQDCPPGLHWNSELNVCDFPAHANCQK